MCVEVPRQKFDYKTYDILSCKFPEGSDVSLSQQSARLRTTETHFTKPFCHLKGGCFQVKFNSFRLLLTLPIWTNKKSKWLAFKNKCNLLTTKRGVYSQCLQLPFSRSQTCNYTFSSHHSMETVIVNVTNDFHVAKSKALFLALLDLHAAFDQLDHSLLLETPSILLPGGSHISSHAPALPPTLLVPPFLYDLWMWECF